MIKIITIQHYDDGWYEKEHPLSDDEKYYWNNKTQSWVYIREFERRLIEDRSDIKSVFDLKCYWNLKTLENWCKSNQEVTG